MESTIKCKFPKSNSKECLDSRFLLTPKLLYFSVGALNYAFYVFRMQFYKEYLGFSEDLSGYVQAAWNLSSLIGVTMWSNLADCFAIHKILLVTICLALSGVFELVLLKNYISEEYWFFLALVTFALYGLLMGGLLPLADDQILKLLKHHFQVDTGLFGRQAMFGMIAYGISTFIMGELIQAYDISILLYVIPCTGLLCATFVTLFGFKGLAKGTKPGEASNEKVPIPKDKVSSSSPNGTSEALSSIKTYLYTLGKPRFICFLLIVGASGLGRQILTLFLPHYLKQELLLSSGEIGRAYLGSALFSIVFYFFGPYSQRFLGVRPMLLVGQGAMIGRLATYALFKPGPNVVPFVELLNGMGHSFIHLAAVKEASDCAPPGWQAAFQAAYNCVHVQIPAVLCSLFGGYLYNIYGGRPLLRAMLVFPISSFITLAFYLLISKLWGKK